MGLHSTCQLPDRPERSAAFSVGELRKTVWQGGQKQRRSEEYASSVNKVRS